MKGFTCFGKKLFSIGNFMTAIVLTVLCGSVSISSCSKDDPVNPVKNHRPNGGNDDANGNGSDNADNGNSSENGGSGGDGNGSNGGSGSGTGTGTGSGGSTTGDGNGDDRTESELRIVGVWVRSDRLEKLNLGLNGSYIAYSCTQNGSEWVISATGHYEYHDLANRLWVEVYGENEDVSAVYRTVFEGRDKLTLWSADNKSRTFLRE